MNENKQKTTTKPLKITEVGGYSAVARLIGCNADTLRSAVRFGKLAGYQLGDGATPVVRIADAQRWMAAHAKSE